MYRIFVLLILVLPVSRASAKSPFIWWTTTALVKVRPSDLPPALRQSVKLHAASNEFEAFQIIVRNDSEAVPDLDIEMSDLAGPGGSVLSSSNVTIYFERYLNLSQPSSIDGGVGEWPD